MNLDEKMRLADAMFGKPSKPNFNLCIGKAISLNADGTMTVQIGAPTSGGSAAEYQADLPMISGAKPNGSVLVAIVDGNPSAVGGFGGDSVIEHGSSGIWKYRKWASGAAECWGNTGSYTRSSWSAWGSVYYCTTALASVDFPSSLFVAAPRVVVGLNCDRDVWLASDNGTTPTKAHTGAWFLVSGSSNPGTAVATLDIHAIGRWG